MYFDSPVVRAACQGIHVLDVFVTDEVKLRVKIAAAVTPVNATAAVTCIYQICCYDHLGLKRAVSSVLRYNRNGLGFYMSTLSNMYTAVDTYCLICVHSRNSVTQHARQPTVRTAVMRCELISDASPITSGNISEQSGQYQCSHHYNCLCTYLFELEVKLKNALVKAASEASFSLRTVVPFTVNDLERNVFVGCARNKSDDASVVFASFCCDLASSSSALTLNLICGCTSLV